MDRYERQRWVWRNRGCLGLLSAVGLFYTGNVAQAQSGLSNGRVSPQVSQSQYFFIDVPAGQAKLTVEVVYRETFLLSGGSTLAQPCLHVRIGSRPTMSAKDFSACHPNGARLTRTYSKRARPPD